jgi:hypothetical protein
MNPPEDASTNDSLALFTTESDVYAYAMTVLEVILWSLDVEMLINTNVCRSSREKFHFTRGTTVPSYFLSLTEVDPISRRSWMSGKTFGSLSAIVGMKSPESGLHPGL